MKKSIYILLTLALVFGFSLAWQQSSALAQDSDSAEMIALGKAIFFDENLSANGTQSCATCHAPEAGFAGPDSLVNASGAVYEGALPHHYGNRRPPTSAYAGDSPLSHYDEKEEGWFGGMFWDGRATGAILGDPLAEQGQGPFLNPLEQAIANEQVLCVKVKKADYADLFIE